MVLLIVLTVVVTFAGTVSLFLNLSVGGIFGCRYSFGLANETIMVPTFAITILLLAYPLKGKISTTTLTSLYIIGSVIGIYGIGHFQNNVNFPVSIARLTLFTEPPLRGMLESMWKDVNNLHYQFHFFGLKRTHLTEVVPTSTPSR